MVCGWLGLSIAGTLVTLGPTVLRTKMEDDAAPSAVRALPFLVAAVGVAAVSVLAGWTVVAGVSLAVYGIGLGAWIGLPLAKATAYAKERKSMGSPPSSPT